MELEEEIQKINWEIENLEIKKRLLEAFKENGYIKRIEVENSSWFNVKITIAFEECTIINYDLITKISEILSQFNYNGICHMEIWHNSAPLNELILRLWF